MCEGVTDTTLSTYQQFNFDFFFRQPKFYAISMEPIYFNFTHQGARFNGTELLEAPPFSIFYGISFSVQLKRSHYNNVQASAQVVYMTPCAGLYN